MISGHVLALLTKIFVLSALYSNYCSWHARWVNRVYINIKVYTFGQLQGLSGAQANTPDPPPRRLGAENRQSRPMKVLRDREKSAYVHLYHCTRLGAETQEER